MTTDNAPEFTVDNIEKALHQLYYDPVSSTKDTAQRWLTFAQRSKQAWQFSWDLLQPNRLTEVQYFGASALVSKISGSWNEVPENEIDSLRERLFSEILRLCVSPQNRIILTRICVAFSSFVMNCVLMKKWDTVISDIIKRLQEDETANVSPMQRCSALLEILAVLAEEHHSRTMEQYQKGIVKHMLIQGMPHVLPLLSNLMNSEDFNEMHGKILKCFSSWVILGIPINEYKDILHKTISFIDDPDLFDNCVECLLNTFCSPGIHKYVNTIKEIIPKVLSLRPMLHQAIEDQDADVCIGITKIVSGLAENQTKLILENYNNPEIGLGLVLMVAECTGIRLQYPTEEMGSPITFTFWYSLQDEVRSLPESDMSIFPQIQPIYYHLVETLVQKSSYPVSVSHTDWSSDEKEQHRIYRIDISDTLMYILEMLGTNMVRFLCGKLLQSVKSMHEKQDYQWQETESILFAIHSVVESMADWDVDLDCLNELSQVLPTIKVENLTLADTLLYTIGALTEWLVYNPQYLSLLIPIVLPCIRTHDLAMTTVLTLKRITRECKEHLVPQAEVILGTAQDALTKGILKNNEVNWLMQSVGHMLSVLSEDECIRRLQSVLMLHMHQLRALSEDPPSGPTKNSIIHILEILASLFSTLDRRKGDTTDEKVQVDADEKQPVLLILQQITPILQEILNRWLTDVAIVQAICDLYDRSIRNLIQGFSPLVETLCDILAKVFQAAPQTSVLDLTQQIMLVFGNDSAHERAIGTLFRTIIETSRRMFEGGHAKEYPDLAQGFMKLLSHTLRKNYGMLFNEVSGNPPLLRPDLQLLIHCALATFSLPESESVKSSSSFIFGFFANCSPRPESTLVFNQIGKDILIAALKGMGGLATRTVIENVADVIFALSKFNFQQFAIWVHELRHVPDVPCTNVDKVKKDMFMTQLLRERAGKRKYRDLVREFSLVCRGLHGTEYAMG
ncbi:importin-13-like [Styela clava]